MDRGLEIAASGMIAEMVRQDQITNDLANASTPGYKADTSSQQSFDDLLLQNTASGQTVGSIALGTRISQITTNLAPAPLEQTGEPLDFGIEGAGFFAVRTAQGVQYTRNGQFAVSAQGFLTDGVGNEVLGQNGGPIRVGPDGRVDPAQLGVFNVTNPVKVGDSNFTGTAGGRATGTVRAGYLESSNADPARATVDMIASMRNYESGQKAIQTIDETLSKAVNSVASIQGS
jgi:flagellar basal-body rod protein FlgF